MAITDSCIEPVIDTENPGVLSDDLKTKYSISASTEDTDCDDPIYHAPDARTRFSYHVHSRSGGNVETTNSNGKPSQ